MARFCLFGDSYVERLRRYSNNRLAVPGEVHFVGRGGLRTDRLDDRMLQRLKNINADAVIINAGGINMLGVINMYRKFGEDL